MPDNISKTIKRWESTAGDSFLWILAWLYAVFSTMHSIMTVKHSQFAVCVTENVMSLSPHAAANFKFSHLTDFTTFSDTQKIKTNEMNLGKKSITVAMNFLIAGM